ncbi:MAG: DUF3300 domain-containing protein [Lautropia sp.]|mgnify:CR=1 FL=1|nr:MAG: DUF3300 domain-containing protein [Pseudomonadota bacterium]MBC6959323.1 DUF3300 domain-containing protein [Lautropia sp.]MCL4701270.1 DUF3300 domain-containing protein [Burkholderiaceae bacterium]MDL1907411.1 DUF3300 domain-containing protein [Betaproteobacteria bacterium PRO1]RIK89989.1 MAG: DUF3300 domain-containing protein [Burkholderiales bacterium]
MKRRGTAASLAFAVAVAPMALAPATSSLAQQAISSAPAQAPYGQQELDQMLAPIALYPDALLAQVLMASTWPLQVVQADRFVRGNPGLTGDALADAVESMPWDPSVRALTQFPSVLAMMSERLEWTGQLGDAFLAQREQVMDTVQSLRARAWAAGTLQSTEQQQVIVNDPVIVIESTRPGYLWVPYYNPMIVFGTWWWPEYPPFFWVPPPVYRPPHFSAIHASGFAWSAYVPLRPRLWHDPRPVWRNRYVVVDNHRVNNVIVTRPGTSRPTVWRRDPPRDRGAGWSTEPRRTRPPSPDGRWQGGPPDARPPRPPTAIAPPPTPRAAPEAPRDFRNGRGAGDARFGRHRDDAGQPRNDARWPRNDFGRPRADARSDGVARREPPRQHRAESVPQRVQKPMPVPRAEMPRRAPGAEPPPQPPRVRPEPHGRHAPARSTVATESAARHR